MLGDIRALQGRLKAIFPGAILWILLLLLATYPDTLAQVHAPAGAVIKNQAFATDSKGKEYRSNIVETFVLAVCQPSVIPNGTPEHPWTKRAVSSGDRTVLHYTLTNVGNVETNFSLAWVLASRSDWKPAEVFIYEDKNHNKRLDPQDVTIEQIRLQPGASKDLLLLVEVPKNAKGKAYIALTATCPSGETDGDNFAEIRIKSGPKLELKKIFTPTEAIPSDTVEVQLILSNIGDEYSEAPSFSDDLSQLTGLLYVPGSAKLSRGTLEFYDGRAWLSKEPTQVEAIRVQLDWLAPGETVVLRFTLTVQPNHSPGRLINRARADGPGGPAKAEAVLTILEVYQHYLGPKDNPRALPGGEGSADDRQQKEAFSGRRICFEHTLENASNVPDQFTIDFSGAPEGVEVSLETLSGEPLEQPIALNPGERVDFRVCLKFPSDKPVDPFTLTLSAKSKATGKENRTYDEVTNVHFGSVELIKSVDPEGTVTAGQELTYTLTVTNHYDVPLHDVKITDTLDASVKYLESSPEGEYSADDHQIRWELSALGPGATWTATVRVKVLEGTPDDTEIQNAFTLTSDELTTPTESNEVTNRVWSSGVLIDKSVSPTTVKVGDVVHYRITLTNPSTSPVTVDLVDEPDPALEYVKGSARPKEPEVKDGKLIWKDVHLDPSQKIVFEYDMRVTAAGVGTLENRASASGVSAGGSEVTTGVVRTRVRIEDAVFASRRATLVGRVFLDFNKNGLYDEGKDRPLPGARLVLSNGLQTTTDGQGNYAFRNLEPGVWLVKLDPTSAPFEPLSHPEALGDGYTHRLDAYGLTTSDFPLVPPEGWIEGYRSTRLSMGPLTVEKELLPLGDGRYRVVLRLSTTEPLPEFELRDPLPSGGERTFTFDPLVGEKTLTYDLEAPAWLTDPEVRWRYP